MLAVDNARTSFSAADRLSGIIAETWRPVKKNRFLKSHHTCEGVYPGCKKLLKISDSSLLENDRRVLLRAIYEVVKKNMDAKSRFSALRIFPA
jgi:hypothetical protein